MSLVNEALKKARLEAARQDAARRGIPLPVAERPTSLGVGMDIMVKVGAALLVVAIAALIFFLGRRSSPSEAAVGAESAKEVAVPAAEPSSASELPAPEDPIVAEPAQVDRAPVRSANVAEPAPSPPRSPNRNRKLDRSRARTKRQASGAPRSNDARTPSSAAAGAAPQEVLRTLELSGSRRIELGGIAWSEERPFALVNGRVVGPGDRVESLTIVAIAPRHVELLGEDGHFLLRLK